MIYFKRNILTALIITTNCMLFNVASPTNKGFEECISKIWIFSEFGETIEDLNGPEAPIDAIKSAIVNLCEPEYNEQHPDVRGYYDKLSHQANSKDIPNQETFCEKFKSRFPILIRHSKKIECLEKLEIFGSDKDEILENALRKYKLEEEPNTLKLYAFAPTQFEFYYMQKIMKSITALKKDSKLETPWQYCCNTHPDDKQNVNPEHQASSSKGKEKMFENFMS